MADLIPVNFRNDLSEYACAVAELCRLATAVPDGLARLRALTAGGGPFVEWSERIEGGVVVLSGRPCARLTDLLADLRRAAGEGT